MYSAPCTGFYRITTQSLQKEIGAASAAPTDIFDGLSLQVNSKSACEICQKLCSGKIGLSVHMRSAHPVIYHATNVPKQRMRARWSDEEVHLVVMEELRL